MKLKVREKKSTLQEIVHEQFRTDFDFSQFIQGQAKRTKSERATTYYS